MIRTLPVATVLAVSLGTSAWASNINLSAKATANNSNVIEVQAGAAVPFKIEGTLNDNLNEGLALIGFDLDFTGGDLPGTTISIPAGAANCGNPMPGFIRPDGITNPDSPCPPQCGFGGTIISGNLIQVGGGQNTIKNTADNADFPVGTVLTGIAKPSGCGTSVVATGSLTAPMAEGSYTLQIQNVFANVIRQGQTGNPFWATDPAGVGTVTNLTINVTSACTNLAMTASAPADQGSLWRSARNIIRVTFSGAVAAVPNIQIREMLPDGLYGPDLSSGFTMEVEGGNVVKIRETASTLVHRNWYAVTTGGLCEDVLLEFVVQVGDADANRFVTAVDVGQVNAQPLGPVADNSRFDINGDGFRTAVDVGLANASQGALPAKPSGH